jgi:murein DD-endopeptidase MepM/ murein hydrolase activator NlpD
MSTLVYAPAIEVLIATRKNGIVDVSEDLTRGQLTLTENAMHSLDFGLLNSRRKYDGIFTPNDRIAVKLKRLVWLQVFAGYLNTVPLVSFQQRSIQLSASCSLKRLAYTPWDPGLAESQALIEITNSPNFDARALDGGLSDNVVKLLTTVANWDKSQIHIGALPSGWLDTLGKLSTAMEGFLHFDQPITGTSSTSGTAGGATGPIAGGGSWATAFMTALGMPTSQPNLIAISAWAHAEGGNAAWNPLNTTEQNVPGHTPNSYNSVGVQNYETFAIGLAATVKTITNGLYGSILNALRAGTSSLAVADGIINSPWGTGALVREILLGGWNSVATRTDTPNAPISPAASSPWVAPLVSTAGTAPTAPSSSVTGTVHLQNPFPGSEVSQPFGHNGHPGIDLVYNGDTYGRPILASGDGTVIFSGPFDPSGYGSMVTIFHGSGIQTNYAHSFRQFVSAGQVVKAGQLLASADTLGNSTGPHLHFEVRVNSDGATPDSGTVTDPALSVAGLGGSGSITGTGTAGGAGAGGLFDNTNTGNTIEDPESKALGGFRALMNDEPVSDTIFALVRAAQRSYCSAPNGDFISWFPDYFDQFHSAGKMEIADVELREDFTIAWDDRELKTHVFVAGAEWSESTTATPGGPVTIDSWLFTGGVATVDFQPILDIVVNQGNTDGVFKDAKTIYERFGARTYREEIPNVGGDTSAQAQFFFALQRFRENWAKQYTTSIPITFMPEMFPGMLVVLKSFGLQAYVHQVVHTFDFSPTGGGFTTDLDVSAPSVTGSGGFYGLPRGGTPVSTGPATR